MFRMKKESRFSLHFTRFFVTLEEFSGFLCIKAVRGIENNRGYDLETVLNSSFCYKLPFNEHPTRSHQPCL